MRTACAISLMILLGCSTAQAQSATTTPAIGATSPLGMLGGSAAGGTGVPLGATETDPGGLSPLGACVPSDPLMQGTSATGLAGSGSNFDGGGLAGAASAASSCTSGTNLTSSGIASPLSGATPNLAGGAIPLGATELDGGGLSPMISVPAPASATGCTGLPPIGSDPTTNSMNLGAAFGTAPGC